jgi:glycosyltransferase involved in cell wall biosynthesis
MAMTPYISVILPCFNSNILPVRIALDSLADQTFTDFECLIIDDSTDSEFVTFLKNYCKHDVRFKYIRGDARGLGHALNKGLSLARGKYIARSDDTDTSDPCRFGIQVDFLDDNHIVDILGSNISVVKPGGIEKGDYCGDHKEIVTKFCYKNPIAHPTVMFRATILEHGNTYNSDFRFCEDLEFWLRLLKQGYKFHNIDQCLVNYDLPIVKINYKNWLYNMRARILNLSNIWSFVSLIASPLYFLVMALKPTTK